MSFGDPNERGNFGDFLRGAGIKANEFKKKRREG